MVISMRNWKKVNKEYVSIGELYLSFDFLDKWNQELIVINSKKEGARYKYLESLIRFCSILKVAFHLGYRFLVVPECLLGPQALEVEVGLIGHCTGDKQQTCENEEVSHDFCPKGVSCRCPHYPRSTGERKTGTAPAGAIVW